MHALPEGYQVLEKARSGRWRRIPAADRQPLGQARRLTETRGLRETHVSRPPAGRPMRGRRPWKTRPRSPSSVMGVARAGRSAVALCLRWKVSRDGPGGWRTSPGCPGYR